MDIHAWRPLTVGLRMNATPKNWSELTRRQAVAQQAEELEELFLVSKYQESHKLQKT